MTRPCMAWQRWCWLLALWLALWAGRATAGIDLSSIEQLKLLSQGAKPQLVIGGAAFRVAVFDFDDPDKTQLGEALALLARHEALLGGRVASLGVLRFTNPMDPEADRIDPGAGYFDRVDRLAAAQQATLSLWGTVRRDGERVVVESYLQVPEATVRSGLALRLVLPRRMGGAPLVGRVGEDRLLLQRRSLSADEAAGVLAAAQRIGELRDRPDAQAPVARRLPMEAVYQVMEQRPGWARLQSSKGSGWSRPAASLCTGSCSPLLDSARFVSGLLAFIDRRSALTASDHLSAEARSFVLQSRALVAMEQPGASQQAAAQLAVDMLQAAARPREAAEPAPLLAGTANLLLLARVRQLLLRSGGDSGRRYDDWQLPPQVLAPVAFDAADALLQDPMHPDLLHNLAVLFALADEPGRSTLARQLLRQAQDASRLAPVPR